MSKRQTQKMLRLMASGEPVELTSAMASVKKLARLAFVAQQFGYEYADVRQGGGNNSQLKMLIVPDPSPHARARAAQNWAQYPNAGDGVSVPPLVPDAFELLKARINFDLTGKSAEKRMGYGALGVSIGCVLFAYQAGGSSDDFVVAAVVWLVVMAILGIGFVVTRKRNAKFAARLQAAGFAPVTDETGRVRYLPPGGQIPGHGNPFGGGGPYGAPGAAPGYGHQPSQPHQPSMPYPQQAPGPYAPQAPAAYGTPPVPTPYGAPPQPPAQAPGPYTPQQPQQPQQPPYGQPAQPPHPQQNPHWQPPQH
ncbi:hypothetical protein GCM10010294_00330 [Streptomyces griseoloalbus]|uniref:hypothetical protein n=1 Tax=Streptomyces griseoloalbus TaxID=67303 RepID=UPI00187658A5|nr:hypothetical protein GCM10010294_00330 [Streptomyces griseoloalbus]